MQIILSVQAKLEVVRRKHIVHPTGFGAFSSTCCKGTDNCAITMGVDQLDNANDNKRPSGHIAALTFHDEFLQKYIGSRWCIGIKINVEILSIGPLGQTYVMLSMAI